MNQVGYLINTNEGLQGDRGIFYDYILASNGLFIEAENKLISARIPVSRCEVRGLAPIEKKVKLLYGSIPRRFFDLALDVFMSDISIEHYVAVKGDAGYQFYIPVQDKSGGGIVYVASDKIVLEMHSHGELKISFSKQDNTDETGLKIFGVVGNLSKTPVVRLRIGVYGYFDDLSWSEVFDGKLEGAVEFLEEEVIVTDELQGINGAFFREEKNSSGRLWRNRWFRS